MAEEVKEEVKKEKPVKLDKNGHRHGGGNKLSRPMPKEGIVSIQNLENDGDGINTKLATSIMAVEQIAKTADSDDLDTLYNCLNQYLQMCAKYDIRVTNRGAYAACGCSKSTIDAWITGRLRARDPRYKKFAQHVRSVCAQYRELLISEGKLNPVTGIWWQKVYDGYTDQPQHIEEEAEAERTQTPEEIAQKYKDL